MRVGTVKRRSPGFAQRSQVWSQWTCLVTLNQKEAHERRGTDKIELTEVPEIECVTLSIILWNVAGAPLSLKSMTLN